MCIRDRWTLVDLACAYAGLVSVPLYPTSTPDQARHILSNSGCRFAFVAGADELTKLAQIRDQLPDLAQVVSFTVVPGMTASSLADELAAAPSDLSEVDARLASASGDDLATIVYTSGTTGEPKGVMLSHSGFTAQVAVLNQYFDISSSDVSLCFLPLSHCLLYTSRCV